MANWGANHGAFSFGHIGADLISLAAILRIPVTMHNVPEEHVFPPERLGLVWRAGPDGRRLPRLCQLWPVVRQVLLNKCRVKIGRLDRPIFTRFFFENHFGD